MKYLLSLLLVATLQVTALSAPDYDVEQPSFVVRVEDDHGSYMYTSTGSMVRADLILTCEHAVRDRTPGSISVVFKDGAKVKARVIRENPAHDLSLLQIKPRFDVGIVQPGFDPQMGDTVTICGFPKAGPYAEVTGEIIDTLKQPQGFEVDEEAIQGMSGGPVLDGERNLVGVVWGSSANEAAVTGLKKIKAFFLDELDNSE